MVEGMKLGDNMGQHVREKYHIIVTSSISSTKNGSINTVKTPLLPLTIPKSQPSQIQ